MQIVLNFCSISVISSWSSECTFVTPAHCLYSTVKLVAPEGKYVLKDYTFNPCSVGVCSQIALTSPEVLC